MSREDMKKEFEKRLYRWAYDHVKCEIENDYPYIRMICLRSTPVILDMMNERSQKEKAALAIALFKTSGAWKSEYIKDKVTAEEISLREEYRSRAFNLRYYQIEKSPRGMSAIKVMKRMQPILSPILGEMERDDDMWMNTQCVDQWEIGTWIHIDNTNRSIRCDQYIKLHNEIYSIINNMTAGMSLPAYYGLGPMEWKYDETSDFESIASRIAISCDKIIKAAPSLLEGINAG